MARIIGDRKFAMRLKKLHSPAARRRIGAAVFAGADEIKTEARLLITAGSIEGKGHVRSLPGQPPNRETGHLDSNIEAVRTGELTSIVESRADYALPLEFGAPENNLEERPYMRPATARKRARVVELVRKAASGIVRRR